MRAYLFWNSFLFFLFAKAHAVASLRVCTTEDTAFDMLVDSKNTKITDVISDQQLYGYDVDMRHEVLTKALNLSYTVRVLPSYGELQVETRKDMCDIGWAVFFVKDFRERCLFDAANCRSLDALETELQSFDSGTVNWTPWRCCIDYMPAHLNYGMAIVFNARTVSFYEALFGAFSQAFFVNFACFTFLLVIIFAHTVYFLERETNPQFPKRYLDGIDDAMWWSIVSVTTVGYGDHYPLTVGGRIVCGFCMLAGIMVLALPIIVIGNAFEEVFAEEKRHKAEKARRLALKKLEREMDNGTASAEVRAKMDEINAEAARKSASVLDITTCVHTTTTVLENLKVDTDDVRFSKALAELLRD